MEIHVPEPRRPDPAHTAALYLLVALVALVLGSATWAVASRGDPSGGGLQLAVKARAL